MKTKLVILIFVLLSSIIYAQNLNGYKYIATPKQFTGFKTPNQYRLNSYARAIFKKNGFIVLPIGLEKWPQEALNNPCLILSFNAKKESSILKNKLSTTLTNCKNNIVVQSEGISSIKEFDKGYQDALKLAIAEYSLENYSFDQSLTLESEINVASVMGNTIVNQNDNTATKPETERPETSEILSRTEQRIYHNANVYLSKEIVTSQKVLFVDANNPNIILVRGVASSLKNVYNVIYTNKKKEKIKTIGYFENNNWVMDLPNGDGTTTKTIFQLKPKE